MAGISYNMEIKLITTLAVFCTGFILSYLGLKQVLVSTNSLTPHNQFRQDVFLPLFLTLLVTFFSIYYLVPSEYDFMNDLSFLAIPLTMLGAGLIYLFVSFSKKPQFYFLYILFISGLGSFSFSEQAVLFNDNIPFWADRIILILLWSSFSYAFQYLNRLDGLLGLQVLTSASGIILLSLLGANPYLLGLFATAFIGIGVSWQIFNFSPARLRLSPAGSMALGFILAWLVILSSTEGGFPCNLCFSMFFAFEVIVASLKKLSLKPAHQNISTNTTYYQAGLSGLPAGNICQAILKILVLLLILGCFQVYAPNAYSLPFLSLLGTAWFSNRLKNWKNSLPSISKVNQDIIEEFKNDFEDLKNNLHKDD